MCACVCAHVCVCTQREIYHLSKVTSVGVIILPLKEYTLPNKNPVHMKPTFKLLLRGI